MREQRDCIEAARRKLLDMGADEAELKASDDAVRATIQEAAAHAQESPEPDPSELWTDVLLEA